MIIPLLTGPLATLTLSLAAWFLLVNAITLTAFYVDNRRAAAGNWGVPAKTLLLLALIGGWPGAKLSHLWFRHTSEQRPFRIMLNLTILPMLGLVGYFATQNVDWAALSDHATAKAMSMLGQTRPTEAAAATTAKPTILVIGKNSVTKPAVITDASPNGLGQTDWAKRRQKRRLAIALAAVSLQVQPQYFSLREA